MNEFDLDEDIMFNQLDSSESVPSDYSNILSTINESLDSINASLLVIFTVLVLTLLVNFFRRR